NAGGLDRKGAHRSEETRAADFEPRMESDGRDPETGRREDSVGRNVRREVEHAVDEQREHGSHRPDRNADAEGIVAARTLCFSAPDRTAGPAEQMRAQEVLADTPDHDHYGNRTDDAELHQELQEIIVGHANVDLARLEHRRLIVPIDVTVGAETPAQHWKGTK